MSFRSPDNRGFTIIEVLIAMTILVFIALTISQATSQTYRLRDELQTEGDFQNGIRLTIDLISRDISMIYSPSLLLETKSPTPTDPNSSALGIAATPDDPELNSGDLAQSHTFWSSAFDKSGMRPSRFQGTADKMSFISSAHERIYKDSTESEFVKITYEIGEDDRPEIFRIEDEQRLKGLRTLVKTESTNAFQLDERRDPFLRKYVLLKGIKALSFRYYIRLKDQWVNTWDSDRPDTKDQFPDLIEVKLEALGPSDLQFEGSFKLKPELPINGLDSRI